MSIKALKPHPIPFVQCCARVSPPAHTPNWRRARYALMKPNMNPDNCMRAAVYEIDDEMYCGVHAAQTALKRWIKGQLIEAP